MPRKRSGGGAPSFLEQPFEKTVNRATTVFRFAGGESLVWHARDTLSFEVPRLGILFQATPARYRIVVHGTEAEGFQQRWNEWCERLGVPLPAATVRGGKAVLQKETGTLIVRQFLPFFSRHNEMLLYEGVLRHFLAPQ